MATPSLLRSSAASFHAQFPTLPPPLTARVPYGNRYGVVSVRATGVAVLVEKSEAERTNRLKTTYLEKIVPLLKEEFSYTNIHQVPKIQKVVVNCGIGDAAQNAKGLDAAMNDLALITGQRPVKTRARNSVATFKIREGQPLGIAVTLRGNRKISSFVFWKVLSLLRSVDENDFKDGTARRSFLGMVEVTGARVKKCCIFGASLWIEKKCPDA